MTTSTLAIRPHYAPINTERRVTPGGDALDERQPVASHEFIRAMRGAATGVNIVTTDGPAGRFGLTVSAFSSVSAEPPMVLVCINRRSPACTAIGANRKFSINVLSEAQRPMADRFAGRPTVGKAYEFHKSFWRSSPTGSPILNESVASFDCSLETAVDAGTHAIFIGTVQSVESTGKSPLIYSNGAYRRTGSKA